MFDEEWTRRSLLASAAGGAAIAGASLALAAPQQETAAQLKLPKLFAPSEVESAVPPAPERPLKRVGFAVVGLGRLSLEQILPAFGQCKRARLVALVSGHRPKALLAAQLYGIAPEHVYDYEGFGKLAANADVSAVYIVLPNGLHREYTLRAAAAGKHVLTEKPMANNAAEAQEMIDACGRAKRKLMVAYRMQYDPFSQEAMRLTRSGELGKLKSFTSEMSQTQGDPDQWRLKRALAGGGVLPDIGLYCLNTARFLSGEEPQTVSSQIYSTPGDARFREVEELVTFSMQFASGWMAQCSASYGSHRNSRYCLNFERGWIDSNPAYFYEGQRLRITRKADPSAEDTVERSLQHKNQFASEIDHMAQCIAEDRSPRTGGAEGLQDHILMEAIYKAAKTGQTIRLTPRSGLDLTRGPELPTSS